MMGFWFSHGASRKGKKFLVLRLGKEEIDFLFFQSDPDGARVFLHGTEDMSHFTARQTLEKIFVQLPQKENIQEMVATFDPSSFKAQAIVQTIPPSSSEHMVDAAEARAIEKEVRRRALDVFQKNLFRESGILPNEFSLRRVKILTRSINGYPVAKLEGFKRGEIAFSLLGMFLLESAFAPLEQFAKEHFIANIRVLHIAEALELFTRKHNQDGVYLHIAEEKTQLAVRKEGRFMLAGDIPMGASHFTEFLGFALGMPEAIAQEFQSEYFQGELSQSVQEKLQTSLLPEIQKFGTLVKKKLLETKMALPEHIWIFGKSRALRDLRTVFREDDLEDLPFSQKPILRFLLPKDVWEGKPFTGASDIGNTALCLLANLAQHGV